MPTATPRTPLAPRRLPLGRPVAVVVALALALALSLVALAPAGTAGAAPSQDVTPTLPTETSTAGSVVEATTTVPGATTSAVTESTESDSTRILTESRKIMAIVGGLVVIALVLSLVTVRYWRQTRPVAPSDRPAPTPAPTWSEPVVAPASAPAVAEERRTEVPADKRRGSRRAVAGADHSGADDDWEPRGTGEHDRVVIEPTPAGTGRPSRPTRAGREAVLRRGRDGSGGAG